MKSRTRTVKVGNVEVMLGPGKAFGSGEHETTGSCLRVLEDLGDIEGASVLDVGCGTGVLGIAALKRGARSVVAFDTDGDAIKTTRANAKLNAVSDRISVFVGELRSLSRGRFDLILANLYGDVIIASMGSLATLLTPGGRLLMSGIRWEDRFELERALERFKMEIRKAVMLQEYVTILAAVSRVRDRTG